MFSDKIGLGQSELATTPRKKKVLQLVSIAAVTVFILYGCVRLQGFIGTSGTDASIWRADFFLGEKFAVPQTATDIYYYTDWGAAEAEFAIAEEDFLSWCRSNGWELKPIDKPIKYFYPVWGPKEDSRSVSRGYYCYATGGYLVFDTEQSRAAFHTSEFP